MKPKVWKRYIGDSFEIIKKDQRDKFTDRLNNIDPTVSIKFTDEPETDSKIPFMDALSHTSSTPSTQARHYQDSS